MTYADLIAALRRAISRELGHSNSAIIALTMCKTAEDLFEVAREHGVRVGFVVVQGKRPGTRTSVLLH